MWPSPTQDKWDFGHILPNSVLNDVALSLLLSLSHANTPYSVHVVSTRWQDRRWWCNDLYRSRSNTWYLSMCIRLKIMMMYICNAMNMWTVYRHACTPTHTHTHLLVHTCTCRYSEFAMIWSFCIPGSLRLLWIKNVSKVSYYMQINQSIIHLIFLSRLQGYCPPRWTIGISLSI